MHFSYYLVKCKRRFYGAGPNWFSVNFEFILHAFLIEFKNSRFPMSDPLEMTFEVYIIFLVMRMGDFLFFRTKDCK